MNSRRRERPRIIIRPADPIDSIRRFLELGRHVEKARARLSLVLIQRFFLNSEGLTLSPQEEMELKSGQLSPSLRMKLINYLDDLVAASDAELPVPVFRIQRKPQIPSAPEDQEEDLPVPKADSDKSDEET